MSKINSGFSTGPSHYECKFDAVLETCKGSLAQGWLSQADARLFVFMDGFIYAATEVSEMQTSRHAGVILVSLDDAPVRVRLSKTHDCQNKELVGRMIALAPGVSRSIRIGTGGALSIHFDPSHPVYFSMAKVLAANGGAVIPERLFSGLTQALQDCRDDVDEATVRRVFEQTADVILQLCPDTTVRDPRIVELIKAMQRQSPLDYEFESILKPFGLSASRFSHLFTANAGLSLRSFLQWKKIKEAIALFETGVSMTEIAHSSGFSDSAHFCRTFNKCLGLKPSMFGPGRTVHVKVLDNILEREYNYG